MPIRITFTVLIFRGIVKDVILKIFLKFRGGNDDRNSFTEVISNAFLFVYPLRGALTKNACACHTR